MIAIWCSDNDTQALWCPALNKKMPLSEYKFSISCPYRFYFLRISCNSSCWRFLDFCWKIKEWDLNSTSCLTILLGYLSFVFARLIAINNKQAYHWDKAGNVAQWLITRLVIKSSWLQMPPKAHKFLWNDCSARKRSPEVWRGKDHGGTADLLSLLVWTSLFWKWRKKFSAKSCSQFVRSKTCRDRKSNQ